MIKRNKYGARKAYRCEDCGGFANKTCCLACQSQNVIKFDSKAEARRYDDLRVLEKQGRIKRLKLHPERPIYIKGKKVCDVVLDFKYLVHEVTWVYEDVKGHDNALSRLKRKMVEAAYGIKVEVIK